MNALQNSPMTNIACTSWIFLVELYYNMPQLLLVIMNFVYCQYLQLSLTLIFFL